MAEYCGYITKIKNLQPLPNADRLLVGQCFDDNIIVDKSYTEGQLVVYFPAGTQLGEEYCAENNLVRKTDENGKNIGGYLENSRCVKAINLRKSKSDGLCLPVSSLSKFTNVNELRDGDKISVLNGIVIAQKYLPKRAYSDRTYSDKEKKKKISFECPLFEEHIDTEHLDKNLDEFKPNDIVQITCKMDGTSHRTAYLPVTRELPQTWFEKLLHLKPRKKTEWEYINGTRRVVLHSFDGGYYGNDEFRKHMAAHFENKLNKGEEVYFEIVGYTGPGGKPIRPTVDNKKVNDKEFLNTYGPVTEFSYGCDVDGEYEPSEEDGVYLAPCCKLFVYRMTMTNEEGFTIEYSPAQIAKRCREIGVETVPLFETFFIPSDCEDPGAYVMEKAKQYYDGPDPVGKTHIREGVVVRILNRSKFTAFKLKNHNYKVLAGIAVDKLVESGEINNMTQDEIDEL